MHSRNINILFRIIILVYALPVTGQELSNPQINHADSVFAVDGISKKLYNLDLNTASINNVTNNAIKHDADAIGADSSKNAIYYSKTAVKPKIGYFSFFWNIAIKLNANAQFDSINKMDSDSSGKVYVMNNSNKLARFNTATGQIQTVGNVQGLNNNKNGDLAFDANWQLYVLNRNGLYKVNRNNLIATHLGTPSWLSNHEPTGLVFTSKGKLYATDNRSYLYELDTANGSSTTIGNLGITITDLAIWRGNMPAQSGNNNNLNLTSICNGFWRVNNPNDYQVNFTWDVYNSSQSGSKILSANQETYFNTDGGQETARIFVNNNLVDSQANNQTPCPCENNASSVISYQQGKTQTGNAIASSRSNPGHIVGPPDKDFFSLGFPDSTIQESRVVLEFDQPVTEQLTIYERTNSSSSYPLEQADIYASNDLNNWKLLGVANNTRTRSQDIHKTVFNLGSNAYRYVKIIDKTDPAQFTNYPDADAFDVAGLCGKTAQMRCDTIDKLYGVGYKNGKGFYKLDQNNGSNTPVTPNIQFGSGATAFHPGLNRIYYVEVTAPHRVAYYDIDSMKHQVINTTGTNLMFNKMAVDSNGAIYAMTNQNKIYTLNPNNGKVSTKHPLNTSQNLNGGGDIAFDSNNNLFLLTKSGFYSIDLNNFNASKIGKPAWLNNIQATGLEFLPNGYFVATDDATGGSNFYQVDKNTGQTTLLGNVGKRINDLTLVPGCSGNN